MITANEFVTRRNTALADTILAYKEYLETSATDAIINGFSDYKNYGIIKFTKFETVRCSLYKKFDESSVKSQVPYLLEAISSVANPNGWEFDQSRNWFKPIEGFVATEKTTLPTQDNFEEQIFVELARSIYNTFISGLEFIENKIDESYDEFQKYSSITIIQDSTEFFSRFALLNRKYQLVVLDALNSTLARYGWKIEWNTLSQLVPCKFVLTPIE